MEVDENPIHLRKVVVVGAGPVGCLAALSFAKMGWRVEVYEGRSDMRLSSSKAAASSRSINLAISERGIAALKAINPIATSRFLQAVIPMKGRMIHTLKGNQQSQAYDRSGMCINSIDRSLLNEGLLEDILSEPNITVFFNHKLTTADFDKKFLLFRDSGDGMGRDVDIHFDLCIGADGSYSNIRRQLMRYVRMDYQQEYIPHEYLELKMPARRTSADGNETTFPLDPNHLHIWPRHSFMLIALPNKDKSFTCTLFAPTTEFYRLRDPTVALAWFKSQFPDAVPHIGETALLSSFKNHPRSPLIAIKAKPYHYKDSVIILGDAAHSMVPFFGQGLNCGFEDVRVLEIILRNEGVDSCAYSDGVDPKLEKALKQYSESRYEDLVAICDLAMNNYVEMRHAVATPSYLFRRTLDNLFSTIASWWGGLSPSLEQLPSDIPFPTTYPRGWLPLYTMVTFRPDIRYSVVKIKAERQDRMVTALGWIGTTLLLSMITVRCLRLMEKIK